MKKTHQIHLRIENQVIEKLKKQALEMGITLSELCRLMIKGNFSLSISYIEKLEFLLQKLEKRLSRQNDTILQDYNEQEFPNTSLHRN